MYQLQWLHLVVLGHRQQLGLAGTKVIPAKLAAMRPGKSTRFRIRFMVDPLKKSNTWRKIEVVAIADDLI